ncbi:penicillin acylase family protein [Kordia sp. YSTF-M3]|uniref:Penicillin acylase family protein n=1 Tax=Kordia aestuariivivens TaxID=2759037 RepID=A0ABR7QD15_9FLAO|nr:penicillin acylase family protein [Kordia aestuariivivens]MBC8756461.1 penicillin acylase family protein [Kordia aestuariivivens]
MKKAAKIIGILLLVIFIAGFWFYTTLLPTYDGTLDIENLQEEVTIHYDTYGIPHIYANNEPDAFTALGYVHAQDRLWQMELIRRIAPGRLSELFGEKLLDTDRFFAASGIDEASEQTLLELDKNSQSYKLAQAYINGINQFVANGATPIEFYLTGTDKTEFTIKDIHNIIGYMAFSFAMAHKTDPLLTDIQQKLGNEYLADLGVHVDPKTTLLHNYPSKARTAIKNTLVTSVHNALNPLPIPQFIGSNSWVIAPQKTATGKVLFANDPHIGFSQPSVWYEAHVHTPTYEMYGYHLAGTPFPLLGHNRKIAYGMTMFENDDIDFYWEENKPNDDNSYKTPTGWETYETRTKTIQVKDGEPVELTYKISRHGPILNQIADGINYEQPVAMSWAYVHHKNQVLEACYIMSHANNQAEFEECLPKIHAPGLNLMYGDAEDNIGWYAVGQLFERPSHVNSKLILDGASGANEKIRYMKSDENPGAVNPPWNYVYSANNQPDSIAKDLYPGYYLPENRAKRIKELIEQKSDWTKDDMMNMTLDVTAKTHVAAIQEVIKVIESSNFSAKEKEAINILKNWNGDNQLTDIAPTIYHKFIYQYLKNTFTDELDKETFDQLIKTHIAKRFTAPLLYQESIWYDNVSTEKKETRKDILLESFKEAIALLETQLGNDVNAWTWNKVHTVEHPHPMGQVETLRPYFNVGPYEVAGTREVINNLGYHYDDSGEYKVYFGPSTRRVVDFSDIENGMSILPTGQSGNPFSPHYQDQAELYIQGKFRKMMLNTEEIKRTSKNTLILK